MAEIEYCEYITGLPRQFYSLLIAVESNGQYIEFYANDSVQVDWGSGKWLTYEKGIVSGRQETPYSAVPVVIRSANNVTKMYFGDGISYNNTYLSIDVIKATTLMDVSNFCYRLEALTTFSFFGNNDIESFESAWEGCTNLTLFEGMDTTRATTFRKAWKGCRLLVSFPNIYSTGCLTVEEAWMGCTSMVTFPLVDLHNCINFNSTWRGNVKLVDLPYLDTGAGEYFNHSFDYCEKLAVLPQLDFSNALEMDYTFAYMRSLVNMPRVDAGKATTFNSTFRQDCNLKCIAAVNTSSVTSRDFTKDMFLYDDKLNAPHSVDQSRIRDGWLYENPNPCYYDVGRSRFYVRLITDIDYCSEVQLTVTGHDFEVDWGDGTFFQYGEGVVYGVPIGQGQIIVKSDGIITKIDLHNDVYQSIEFKKASDINDVVGLCKDFTKLYYFESLTTMNTTDFTDMLSGCSILNEVGVLDLSYALNLTRTFRGCSALTKIGERYFDPQQNAEVVLPLDMSSAITFYETFYGCSSFEWMQILMTESGTDFTRMMSYMTSLVCFNGIDTRNQTTTYNMFDNSNELVRPNTNERNNILVGGLYNNGGNCGGEFQVVFKASGSVQLQFDGDVSIDWGNGIYLDYPADTLISDVNIDNNYAYILGELVTAPQFITDTFTEVEFVSTPDITDMTNMFISKSVLDMFTFSGTNNVVDFTSAFESSGIRLFTASGFNSGVTYTNMFKGTSNLDKVGNMNTLEGIYFEGMFEDSGINCIQEINTCKGIFPPSYLSCAEPTWNCHDMTMQCDEQIVDIVCPKSTEMITCTPGHMEQCRTMIACDSFLDRFGNSTMFTNATPTKPDSEQREKIMNRFHYTGVTEC